MDISYNFGDYYSYPMEVIMKTIAIVTGASSGIGKQFVKLFLKEQSYYQFGFTGGLKSF